MENREQLLAELYAELKVAGAGFIEHMTLHVGKKYIDRGLDYSDVFGEFLRCVRAMLVSGEEIYAQYVPKEKQ